MPHYDHCIVLKLWKEEENIVNKIQRAEQSKYKIKCICTKIHGISQLSLDKLRLTDIC